MYSVIGCRRPEIIFVDKRAKEAKTIDIAIRGDARVKDKELEKIEKSQFLEKRNRKVVEGEVKVVPIVIEALGAVSDMFEKLNVAIRLEVMQKAALLGTAGLLRKVWLFREEFVVACYPRVIYQAT